jgi:hypothetical protein
VEDTLVSFGISLSHQFEEDALVCSLTARVVQQDKARRKSARHTAKQIKDLKVEALS